jgi:hypothetical protein
VIWDASGKVFPLKTARGRADGIAEATNRSGLTVGYLGNLGTDKDPERDQTAVWRTRTAEPRLRGRVSPNTNTIAELVDLNDINARGAIVGNVYGLVGKDFSKLRRIDPVLWTCAFGR